MCRWFTFDRVDNIDDTLLQDEALTVSSRTYRRWMDPVRGSVEGVSKVVPPTASVSQSPAVFNSAEK